MMDCGAISASLKYLRLAEYSSLSSYGIHTHLHVYLDCVVNNLIEEVENSFVLHCQNSQSPIDYIPHSPVVVVVDPQPFQLPLS